MESLDERTGSTRHAGELLRDWRQRRRLTQEKLAIAAGISTRLLGTLETGQSLPNRDIVLRLAERLDVPLRARNTLLIAAGFEAAFPVRVLGDPVLTGIWSMIDRAVNSHAPNPSLALDRRWSIVASNDVLRATIADVDPALLSTPANWARLTLHPAGLAPRIPNLHEWHGYVLGRLRLLFESTGDAVVADLIEEIRDYPVPPAPDNGGEPNTVAIPLRLMTVEGLISFYCASTVFGSAVDVMLAELTVETLYPADPETAAIMRQKARPAAGG
jgi:transcriptional regulator with XRE-family HTH domain